MRRPRATSGSRRARRDHSIRANPRVWFQNDAAQYFRSSPNVHVTAEPWRSHTTAGSDRHLLEDQAIDADFGLGVDYDAIWVRD